MLLHNILFSIQIGTIVYLALITMVAMQQISARTVFDGAICILACALSPYLAIYLDLQMLLPGLIAGIVTDQPMRLISWTTLKDILRERNL